MSQIATIVFVLGILALFARDFLQKSRTSWALWVPMLWFLIIATRPVSMWLNMAPEASPDQVLDGSPVDRAGFVLLLGAGLAVLVARSSRVKALLADNKAILLFFSYCCLSILWSDYPWVAWKRWMKLVGDLVMVLIVLTDLNPRGAFKRFLAWPTFLLVPLSVLFIKYIPSLGRGYTRWTHQPVFHGITYNKNLLGVICVVWGLGLVWAFRDELRERKVTTQSSVIFCVLLAMVLWLLKTAHSATSLSCFALGCILMLWTSIPLVARRPVLIHIVAVAMVCASFSVLFIGVGGDALDALGKDSTLTGRTELWQKVFKMTENPIWGTGFESFWLGPRLETLWAQYWWQPNQAHNGYIETYINLGWIGVAALLAMIVTAYGRSIAAIRIGDHDGTLRLAYVIVAVIHNFTEASFRMQNLVWITLLFALIGIPMSSSRRSRGSAAPSRVRLVPVSSVRRKAGELVGAGARRQQLGTLHP